MPITICIITLQEALIPMDYLKKDLIRFFNLEECHARSLYDLLRYHMCQIRFNTCTVSVNTLAMVEDEKEDVVKEVVKQKIGIAIYLTASMFNHSCDPNVFFRFASFFVIICSYFVCFHFQI